MVSDTRIKEIAENCHDDLNRCYELNTVGTVEDAIKQALAEEREAVADWLEELASDYQGDGYFKKADGIMSAAKQLRDKQ